MWCAHPRSGGTGGRRRPGVRETAAGGGGGGGGGGGAAGTGRWWWRVGGRGVGECSFLADGRGGVRLVEDLTEPKEQTGRQLQF